MITKKTDYAMRLLRSLSDGKRYTAVELSKKELIPPSFVYKILKKLANANYIHMSRGTDGGCELLADLNKVTLYDLIVAMEENKNIISCMNPEYKCSLHLKNSGCSVKNSLSIIQRNFEQELKSHSLSEILL